MRRDPPTRVAIRRLVTTYVAEVCCIFAGGCGAPDRAGPAAGDDSGSSSEASSSSSSGGGTGGTSGNGSSSSGGSSSSNASSSGGGSSSGGVVEAGPAPGGDAAPDAATGPTADGGR